MARLISTLPHRLKSHTLLVACGLLGGCVDSARPLVPIGPSTEQVIRSIEAERAAKAGQDAVGDFIAETQGLSTQTDRDLAISLLLEASIFTFLKGITAHAQANNENYKEIFFIGASSTGLLTVDAAHEMKEKSKTSDNDQYYFLSSRAIRNYPSGEAFRTNSGILNNNQARAMNVGFYEIKQIYDSIENGKLPVNLWGLTRPPIRIRVILYSDPPSARLYSHGLPTQYSTITDLYMLPEDIQSSDLQIPGYAPCQLSTSIVPWLVEDNNGEAMTVRCNLLPLAKEGLSGQNLHSRRRQPLY